MVVDGGFRTEKPSTEGDAKVLKVWVGLNVELSFTRTSLGTYFRSLLPLFKIKPVKNEEHACGEVVQLQACYDFPPPYSQHFLSNKGCIEVLQNHYQMKSE